MREILIRLLEDIDNNRPVSFCRLVATRGSTPQKPGAVMLVYANGDQQGTLGGGCVEAEVKRQAIASLKSGRALIREFLLDSDYGWDDGLICGGRMDVMLMPITDLESREYFADLHDAFDGGGGTEAILMESAGSDVLPVCWLFDRGGNAIRSLPGDASAESRLAVEANLPVWRPSARPSCDDAAVYLPIEERCRLVIVGAGHVGQAVAALVATLGFDVVVADDRPEYATAERFPAVVERRVGSLATLLPQLAIDGQTYCLIVTRGHNHDQEALFHLVNRDARYVGMIGSRRKIRLIFENLQAEGISRDALAAVYAPVGLDIGSQTVPEIAISIAAELVAHRNLGQVPGRRNSLIDDNA